MAKPQPSLADHSMNPQMNIRFDRATHEKLKRARAKIARERPGMNISLQDVIRIFIHEGLEKRA